MKIDVVIPNFNGSALIRKNLPKVIVALTDHKQSKIIIVDDASDSKDYLDLVEFVKSLKSEDVVLIKNERNMGFSSTVNRGVFESKSDLVVLLNSDVTPVDNFLEQVLHDFENNPNLFGVGLMDRSIENGKTILRGRGLASWKRGFVIHRRGEVDASDTFWISGGSSIVKRELFVKLGGFNPIFNPFYWEDIDLSYRARKAGYELKFESESVVEHKHEEGAIKKHFTSNSVKTIAYRNQFIFIWKNISDISLLASHILWLPYHIVKALLRMDLPFFIGLLYCLSKMPKILLNRRKQKKLYKLSDHDLFRSR